MGAEVGGGGGEGCEEVIGMEGLIDGRLRGRAVCVCVRYELEAETGLVLSILSCACSTLKCPL